MIDLIVRLPVIRHIRYFRWRYKLRTIQKFAVKHGIPQHPNEDRQFLLDVWNGTE